MSRPEQQEEEHGKSSGPNLLLIYGLIALGFVIAMGCAALIVLPFYWHRR